MRQFGEAGTAVLFSSPPRVDEFIHRRIDFVSRGIEAEMNTPESIKAALIRLAAALDQLDAAAGSRSEDDVLFGKLKEELAAMRDDRSTLQSELDGALARSKKLEFASEEVARRLKAAGASINAILAGTGARDG
ncbi:protein of unknown function [Methylocapsa palsarum]|uniref:Uncharacterized protein n=2 Tax=Methylocapsa palsarum TaxID=1612308 RepID=A0A1I3XV80_9HYPH|nr:protein of unknown function [Methylocapsa palsarum]